MPSSEPLPEHKVCITGIGQTPGQAALRSHRAATHARRLPCRDCRCQHRGRCGRRSDLPSRQDQRGRRHLAGGHGRDDDGAWHPPRVDQSLEPRGAGAHGGVVPGDHGRGHRAVPPRAVLPHCCPGERAAHLARLDPAHRQPRAGRARQQRLLRALPRAFSGQSLGAVCAGLLRQIRRDRGAARLGGGERAAACAAQSQRDLSRQGPDD